MNTFRFAARLSQAPDLVRAIEDVCGPALAELGETPDLAVLFASADRSPEGEQLAAAVCDRLGTDRLVGCTGESIVGVGREVEGGPALSLWLAKFPGAAVLPMHLTFTKTPEGPSLFGWPDELLGDWPENASLLVLGDPFTFPADLLLERVNEDHPGVPVFGGMASGGSAPGENRLLLGRQALEDGSVAVLFHGAIRVRTVVSQGCRPIGKPFVVTRAERNVIHQLGGQPALVQLNAVYNTLATHEQDMVRSGLHVGRVVSEYQAQFEIGDFLVRNVIGMDPRSGAIAIGDWVRVGQTVQFHVRDWETAAADLDQLLGRVKRDPAAAPGGALLFTCNGRGTRLFPHPHHDAGAVHRALGDLPLAGFFAQGELGPVGGKNFVHGFTASLALFEPA